MPWKSFGYNKKDYNEKCDLYGVRGIPTLVLLKEDFKSEATS